MQYRRLAVFLLCSMLAMAGCGGGGGGDDSGSSGTSESTGSTISISPSSVSLVDEGSASSTKTQYFSIVVTNSTGSPLANTAISITAPNITEIQLYDGSTPKDSPFTATTDENGAYNLRMDYISGGGLSYSGTLEVRSGSVYSTVQIDVSNNTGDSTYSISGTVTDSSNVAMSGVTVALTGTGTGSATTDSSGNFTFTGLANGSYTITPSKTGYTFNPASKVVTVSGANITGQSFVGSASGSTGSISGTVTDSSNVAMSGVTVALTGTGTGSATTDSSGNFTFTGLANGSYTITPSKTGYTFNPASKVVTVSGANITGQSFVGSASGSTGGGSNYILVATGNKWTYQDPNSNTAMTGEITQSSGSTYSFKGTNSSYSSSYYNISDYEYSDNAWRLTKIVMYNDNDGSSLTLTYSPPQLTFPSKTDIGTHETQTFTASYSNGSSFTQTVDITIDGFETVTVPAGTFTNALKLTYTWDGGTPETTWYVSGVGCIKMQVSTGPAPFTWELASYTIN